MWENNHHVIAVELGGDNKLRQHETALTVNILLLSLKGLQDNMVEIYSLFQFFSL